MTRARLAMLAAACAGCHFQPGEVASQDTASPRCTSTDDTVACDFVTVVFRMGLASREVHVQHPSGEPPDGGWPAVLLFQGSFHSAELSWSADVDASFGGFHQAELVRDLLAAGYSVITPETMWDGATYWQTNVFPTSSTWSTCQDHALMLAILAAIDDGTLGPIDGDTLFAGGISSGGYMTSRTTLAYPGRFRALAIQSASWATCGGMFCVLPATLPEDHPPTLFLHGEDDAVVPIETMERYAAALEDAGVPVERVTDPDEGHAWLATAPETVVAWFEQWR